jgi:hypothetical protein
MDEQHGSLRVEGQGQRSGVEVTQAPDADKALGG